MRLCGQNIFISRKWSTKYESLNADNLIVLATKNKRNYNILLLFYHCKPLPNYLLCKISLLRNVKSNHKQWRPTQAYDICGGGWWCRSNQKLQVLQVLTRFKKVRSPNTNTRAWSGRSVSFDDILMKGSTCMYSTKCNAWLHVTWIVVIR